MRNTDVALHKNSPPKLGGVPSPSISRARRGGSNAEPPRLRLSKVASRHFLYGAATPPNLGAPAFLTQYCITCHNQRLKTADLTLDTMDVDHVEKNAAVWEKVVRKIKTGMMPPSGARRPDRAALDNFATEVETRLDRAAALSPNPGTPALHRLNRTEYANAIRDLLAVDVDVSTLLPGDDSTEGFDNIADALGTSPALVQGYVSAAMKISRRAVGDRTLIPTQITYPAPSGLSQDRHIEGLPLGTRGGMLVQHTFPMDAEYEFNVGGGFGGGTGGALIDVTRRGSRRPAEGGRRGRSVFGLPDQIGVHGCRRHYQRGDQWSVQCRQSRRHAEPAPHIRLLSRKCW